MRIALASAETVNFDVAANISELSRQAAAKFSIAIGAGFYEREAHHIYSSYIIIDAVLWPVYVSYPKARWENEERAEYAKRAARLHNPTLYS